MTSTECLRAIQKVLEETVCDPREEGADGLEKIDVIVGAWDEKALPDQEATRNAIWNAVAPALDDTLMDAVGHEICRLLALLENQK